MSMCSEYDQMKDDQSLFQMYKVIWQIKPFLATRCTLRSEHTSCVIPEIEWSARRSCSHSKLDKYLPIDVIRFLWYRRSQVASIVSLRMCNMRELRNWLPDTFQMVRDGFYYKVSLSEEVWRSKRVLVEHQPSSLESIGLDVLQSLNCLANIDTQVLFSVFEQIWEWLDPTETNFW